MVDNTLPRFYNFIISLGSYTLVVRLTAQSLSMPVQRY